MRGLVTNSMTVCGSENTVNQTRKKRHQPLIIAIGRNGFLKSMSAQLVEYFSQTEVSAEASGRMLVFIHVMLGSASF